MNFLIFWTFCLSFTILDVLCLYYSKHSGPKWYFDLPFGGIGNMLINGRKDDV